MQMAINIIIFIIVILIGMAMFYAVVNPEQAKMDVEELFARSKKKRCDKGSKFLKSISKEMK